ncbi:bifunctional glycosyltransferase/CDP-glycerol:glycerophosphate glycerophosphotransferase [Vagococcus salmoninarum]|uniref:Glycosyltransferase 2-like domain-containing protein n=1 Tax=Vagococcus salmoninarum TaxID=2739 RepID=A0A429ZPU0_9ENTE|nr:CDP-glycerol glycerophosphotransferase family protein [Vagococcus salmoninarum]RST95701.1 hypothetical protein CBF35_06950 [Vagococcus salmoninarum]
MNIDVSIIIPTYNVEEFVEELTDSLMNQTFRGKMECLFIDDGSSDDTVEKLTQAESKLVEKGIFVSILNDGQNLRQGARRNAAIKKALGKYILFLDSDDWLHSSTIELTFNAAEEEEDTDLVYFNYTTSNPKTKWRGMAYYPNEAFLKADYILNEDCEKLLALQPYFCVNKLYKKEFIISNNIAFGEGYFYEDIEFYAHVATTANKIRVIPNLLYYVRVNENSTTQSLDTENSEIHLISYMQAVTATYEKFSPRSRLAKYNLLKYLLDRLFIYVDRRLVNNKEIRNKYITEGIELLVEKNQDTVFPNTYKSDYYYSFFKTDYFKNKDIEKLKKVYSFKAFDKKKLKRFAENHRLASEGKNVLNRINVFNNHDFILNRGSLERNITKREKKQTIKENKPLVNYRENMVATEDKILMLGFDYDYKGNSRYLFEYLKSYFSTEQLKFVTTDERVPEDYRIEPRSKEFDVWLSTSKAIIAESWVPLDFYIHDNQKLIQLWHGTPLKKLLFDSHEIEIVSANPSHKVRKKWDVNRWDYLLSDSPIATKKFKTAFSIEESDIIETGYSRNNWLLENKQNTQLKSAIKEKLSVANEEIIILYAPTWRDYNYKTDERVMDYLLDFSQLEKHLELPSNHVFLFNPHDMDVDNDSTNNVNKKSIPKDVDTQELLLVADIVISDYSSIIFDCLYADVPFYLLMKDKQQYAESRGIYDDLRIRLEKVTAYNEAELALKMTGYKDLYTRFNKTDLISENTINSNEEIKKLITNIFKTPS